MALEGNEIDKKIGEYGSAIVDITDKGMLKIAASVEVDLIAELEKLAAKSGNKIDDQVVAALKSLMGRV